MQLKQIIWIGDSKKAILDFPEKVRKLIGDQLQLLQRGGMPKDAKPFKGIDSGIIEIALKHNKEAYRCVQAIQLDDNIYVLHAFHKKSKKGIATPKEDIELIKQRYQKAKDIHYEQKGNTKH